MWLEMNMMFEQTKVEFHIFRLVLTPLIVAFCAIKYSFSLYYIFQEMKCCVLCV